MTAIRFGAALAALAIGGNFAGAGDARAIDLYAMHDPIPGPIAGPVDKAGRLRAVTFKTRSVKSLRSLFDGLGFDLAAVPKGMPVPRVLVSELPTGLKSMKSVKHRTRMFRKILLPLILQANETILRDREKLLALRRKMQIGVSPSVAENGWLWSLARHYRVRNGDLDALILRVDAIPPSLALAQAIEESGWGTSSYARKGNAIFGQETSLSATNAMTGSYRGRAFKIKTFASLLAAVDAYARNLNTHPAYRHMRAERSMMRARGERPGGRVLAGTLLRYSERGPAYIRTIRTIMGNFDLQKLDGAELEPGTTIHVIKR
ncbi:MAG: glucosaminidase domain-containing protein [Alphaproteobacteria bacterium]|nr:glucosaminidase domain-containing protein [Alphaproteobacteria bacterium]